MLDLFLLARVHGLLLRQLFRTLRFELTVVTRKQANFQVFDVGNTGTDLVQEVPVMRDDQQNTFVALQPAFEPQDGGQVEVVSGLIQQQDVGTAHERPGEVKPHSPAARKSVDGLLHFASRKSQPVQQPCGASLCAEPVDDLHAFVQGMRSSAMFFCLARRDRSLNLPQLGVTVHDVINRGTFAMWTFLGNVGDFIVRSQPQFTFVGFQLTEQHGKQ